MAHGSVKMCLQCATCSMVSCCLFRALKFLSCRDSKIKAEACRWPKGKTLRLEIPGARGFTVTGTEKGFRKHPLDTPGEIGIAQAYAEHRFTLRGNMGLAMPFVRCVDRTEGYLFPPFLARRILKRLPKKEVSTARVYLAVLLGR